MRTTAPEPKYREIAFGKLAIALLIEGAIFGVLRGLPTTARATDSLASPGSGPGKSGPTRTTDAALADLIRYISAVSRLRRASRETLGH